jgi:putative transposase
MPHRALRFSPTKDATDLTDEQRAALALLVVTPSPNGGRPTDIDRRAIVNALRDNHRTAHHHSFPRMHKIRVDEGYKQG